MNLRKFLEQLRAMRNGPHHGYTWRPAREHGWVRTNEPCSVGTCHCPITALAEDTTGGVYTPSFVRSAGKMLGLSEATMNHIVDASDANYDVDLPAIRTLRKRICEALQGDAA